MKRSFMPAIGLAGLGLLLVAFESAYGQDRVDLGELDPLVTFRLSERPLISIGSETAPEYELFQVRGAVVLTDGRIAVLNGGTNQVRIYSRDGEHLASWGRGGDGPGEFRSAERLFRTRGDSLVVWDARTGRGSVLTADDGLIRSISLDPHPPAARLEGVDREGRLLIVAMRMDPSSDPEISRMPEEIFLHGPDGTLIQPLGEAPGMSGLVRSSGERVEVLRPLVGPTSTYAFDGERLWIETGEDHQLQVIDVRSGVKRVFGWRGHDLTMTEAWVEAIIRDRVEEIGDPEARRRMRTSLEARPVPRTGPATERVMLDPGGRAWLQLSDLPEEERPLQWMIFRPDGAVVARVEVPRGVDLQSVEGREVVVVERDEFDAEHVRIYQLQIGS